MKISEAKSLISGRELYWPKNWLDLGCGAGTFTYALAEVLNRESKIYALDQMPQKLEPNWNNIPINFIQLDFITGRIELNEINGIMMANALHFVSEKEAFINKLIAQFGMVTWLIVEYERVSANQWVPYPIPFYDLNELFLKTGYSKIEKTGMRKSAFGGEMYATYIQLETIL